MKKKFIVLTTIVFLISIKVSTATINTHHSNLTYKAIQLTADIPEVPPLKPEWYKKQLQLDGELDGLAQQKKWRRLGSWLNYNSKAIKNRYFESKTIAIILQNESVKSNPKDLAYILEQCFQLFDKCSGTDEFVSLYKEIVPTMDPQYLFWVPRFWINGISKQRLGLSSHQWKQILVREAFDAESIYSHFKNLYRKKAYDNLIQEIPAYIKKENTSKSRLRELLVKSYLKTRQYSKLSALLDNDRWREQNGVSEKERLRLVFRISLKRNALWKAENTLQVMKRKQFQKSYHRSLFTLGHRFLVKKQFRKSLELYKQIDFNFLSKRQVETVNWNLFNIFQKLGRNKEIPRLFKWFEKHDFSNHETASKFCYWGKKMNLLSSSKGVNCSKKYPNTYYGLHLRKKREGLVLDIVKPNFLMTTSKSEQKFLKFVDGVYQSDKYELGDFLVSSYFKEKLKKEYFEEMGNLLVKHQRYYLLQRLIGSHYYGKLKESKIEVDKAALFELYYPKAYKNLIKVYSKKYEVPEFLIYSVMREESRFKDKVVSGAGAIGLMQLMPKTAKYIAKRLRVKVKVKDLTHPKTNIMLGAKYLSRLLKRFNGNLFYVLAAYNGGPTNAKRWIRTAKGKDINGFIEGITFKETQNYVKRVMKSFYTYQMLYETKQMG